MSDETSLDAGQQSAAPIPQAPEPQPEVAASEAVPTRQPAQLAKIRTLHSGVQVRGFTLGRDQTVSGVSLAMAQHLESSGQVRILDIL